MKGQSNDRPTNRLVNMDLLRIVSMMFVVIPHYLGKGGFLTPLLQADTSLQGYVAWGIEFLTVESVNVYMLLSGYFLIESKFSVKRLLGFILQILFYSFGIGIVAAMFGCIPGERFSISYLLLLCLPVSMSHYWFMTAYVFMYLFSPILSKGIMSLTKRQFQTVLVLVICAFSLNKSVLPICLEADTRGTNCIWYLCMFLIAAYIRLYGIPFFKNIKRSFFTYLGSGACIYAAVLLLQFIYLKTGKLESSRIYDSNHILVLTTSVALFYIFYHIKIKNSTASRIICRIAPYTLGVYLWHEHVAIRNEWIGWIHRIIGKPSNTASLLISIPIAAAIVFAIGILIDMIRSFLFSRIHMLLLHVSAYRSFDGWLNGLTIEQKKEEVHE